jgi:DNA-directed RNA polymerase specialized sigma subunit
LIARAERQAPRTKERLAAFAKDYAKREAALEQQAENLRRERDQAIRVAYGEGLPMKAIAQIMHLSHQRVSQIVRS